MRFFRPSSLPIRQKATSAALWLYLLPASRHISIMTVLMLLVIMKHWIDSDTYGFQLSLWGLLPLLFSLLTAYKAETLSEDSTQDAEFYRKIAAFSLATAAFLISFFVGGERFIVSILLGAGSLAGYHLFQGNYPSTKEG